MFPSVAGTLELDLATGQAGSKAEIDEQERQFRETLEYCPDR